MNELFEKIIMKALRSNVTDIHFYLRNDLMISMRRYGKLERYDVFDKSKGEKLLNFIKYKAFIDLNFRLKPQTGRFYYFIKNKKYDLRVSYLPSDEFESIVIRILNNHHQLSLDDITSLVELKNYYLHLTKRRNGLFIVSGATGSGKSTTLYTLLDLFIQEGGLNIITIEDPIEMHKEGCIQIEINTNNHLTYQELLKQILRHDPDIILVGEIRDEIVAKLCITCALTGHFVLTTLHAPNALLTLKRLLNLNISKNDLESVLIGIVSQRIKYDDEHNRVIILSELLNRKQICDYLMNKNINYSTFLDNAKILIKEHHIKKELFEAEFDE